VSVLAPGRVPIVRPKRATIVHGVAGLHAAPDGQSELVDEALLGEVVTILGEQDGWAFVQGEDHYFGWASPEAFGPAARPRSERIVAVHGAAIRSAADPEGAVVDAAAPGTVVQGAADAGWIRCGTGWIAVADTAGPADLPERPPMASDLLATAETFVGTPYLWGGVSARGIDCSGLTQQVYRLNGVGLPRDADQQALCGRPVDVAVPGDLFFFGAERVTHTAIATGPRTYVHAPQNGGAVEHGELGPDRRVLAIRRLLP
jgi:cell wall-associated NlpC family hydrolase